jgi:hypothetical protein
MNSLPYLPAFIGQWRQYESVPLFGARFRSQHFPRALKREESAKEEGEHVSLSPPRFISAMQCDDVSNNGDLKWHELIVPLESWHPSQLHRVSYRAIRSCSRCCTPQLSSLALLS